MTHSQTQALTWGTAIITGAGSGIGRGLALMAARRGMNVIVTDKDESRARSVCSEIQSAGGNAVGYFLDVTDRKSIESVSQKAFNKFDDIRLVICNAGVESTSVIWEMEAEHWRQLMDVNLNGVFNCIQGFVPQLIDAQLPAHIVNIASLAALASGPTQQGAYNASKHAVLSLTENLYLELKEHGHPIDAHVVCPGPVSTRIFKEAYASTELAISTRDSLADYVDDAGISGIEAGERILSGVEAGNFWVSTHPDLQHEFMQNRATMIASSAPPLPYVPKVEADTRS